MISHTTASFRAALAKLPAHVRARARDAYRRFQTDPHSRGLQFKRVHPSRAVYSARVMDDHRAVGLLEENVDVWFWIGKHEEYERLLKLL